MRTLWLSILLAAFCPPTLAQLESDFLTVAATRSIGLQPDQAVITISVPSGLDGSLEEILGIVADAGITEADFSDVTVMNEWFRSTLRLRWDFNLSVPIAQLQDTISSLRGLGLTYALRGVQVSQEKRASEQCPRADLIADATAQARKMALAAAVSLGPILSVADGGAVGGAVGAVLVPAIASRRGDFSVGVIAAFPPLPPSQPVVCSLVVKFGLGR
jgi:hypothetical protein